MRLLTFFLVSVLFLFVAAHAAPTKQDCKGYVNEVKDLSDELGLAPGIRGRAMMAALEKWAEDQDAAAIDSIVGRIEKTTTGVRQCEAAGFGSKVMPIKATSRRLETAALPWLRNSSKSDVCQSLINQAARKREDDPDGAIADLERSVAECDDDIWLPEAHRTLASLYFERGEIARKDYEMGRAQTGHALGFAEGREESDRLAFVAILARPTIEAGSRLMDLQSWEEAGNHWQGYIDLFGGPSFDVLFDVSRIAHGTQMLRGLKDARYQLTLTCIERGDGACVTESIVPYIADYKNDPEIIRELTGKVFALADQSEGTEAGTVRKLAFDLLTEWHRIDPDSYQIRRLIQDVLIERDRGERLAILRSTDACWIPIAVADTLRQNDEAYFEELQIAANCDPTSDRARLMLDGFHAQSARNKLSRLGTSRSSQEQRALIAEIEQELLPKIAGAEDAEEIRSRLAQEKKRLQRRNVVSRQDNTGVYAGCTDLLATIQWNRARENDYLNEEREFKRGCCGVLMSETAAWKRWMGTRAEGALAPAEVENKAKLMQRYCDR